jgi:HK97 family phage major capsid protein
MTTPGIVQNPWSSMFPADTRAIVSAIVGGAPFSRACTPLPTQRTSVAFGTLDPADPEWGAELDPIPDLSGPQSAYEVAVSRLAGTILISQESIADTDFPVTQQTEQVLRDTFSAKLDRDLIGAAGPAPTPTGILSVAAASDGTDLLAAAVKAKADIGTAGGQASHIALSPHFLGQLEDERAVNGEQLYPDAGTTFAGLATVSTVAATQPFVFDRSRCWLVVRRDFTADSSDQTDSAWSHYALSLRVIGRFALAIPQPSKACRKLTVAGIAPTGGEARPSSSGKRAAA